MAQRKESIVIVLDVGLGMHDDSEMVSALQKSKTCISMILQRKIFSESKDEIALVLLGTSETANKLSNPKNHEYINIKVAQGLKVANWDLLRYVQDIEGTDISSDFIDALVIAMDILHSEACKFTSQRIILFSTFASPFCNGKLDVICEGLKTAKMEINIIGPPGVFDETEVKKEQVEAEAVVKMILKASDGESYSFNEALPALVYYQKKKTQSAPWNATLQISSKLTIPIVGYIKIAENKAKSWKTAYCQNPEASTVKEISYHLKDEAQSEVTKDNIIEAYRYGTTLVPFSEEDRANMKYKSGDKGMMVLGFTKEENIRRHLYMGDRTTYIFNQKNNKVSTQSLGPFIQALFETKMVAVVRYVNNNRSNPRIGFLAPRIKPAYECLIYRELPFMEDLRHHVFASLDSDSRNLPTDEQLSIIDDLINAMDLSVAAVDEEGNKGEALKSKNTVNPMLQRLYQCLQHRVFHPDNPLPEMPPQVKAIVEPAPELLNAAEPIIKKLKQIFPLKRKIAFQSGGDVIANGKSDGDASEVKRIKLVNDTDVRAPVGDQIIEVGTVKPVEDFEHLIKEETLQFSEVCKQLEKAVLKLLTDAMVNVLHEKILACFSSYRKEALKKEEVVSFNSFLRGLKSNLISKHEELWSMLVKEKIGLISNLECCASDVLPEESAEFFVTQQLSPEVKEDKESDDEEDDLLAQM